MFRIRADDSEGLDLACGTTEVLPALGRFGAVLERGAVREGKRAA